MQQNEDNFSAVILAAGMGKRMKSDNAKVLHEVLGIPMISYILRTADSVFGDNIILVVGYQADEVKKKVSEQYDVIFAFQKEQRGTGHAVLCALPQLPQNTTDVIILCGDVPLLTSGTLRKMIKCHKEKNYDLSVLSVKVDNPEGYGRLIFDDNSNLCGIVEEADANAQQKKRKIVNAGIYCVKADLLKYLLPKVKSDNAQGEQYITDIVELAYQAKKAVGAVTCCEYDEVMGVNSQYDLLKVEKKLIDEI